MMSTKKGFYSAIGEHLGSLGVVVDVGAYVGDYARYIIRHVDGKAKNYYLIEACPKNFQVLKVRCGKMRLFNMAVSNKNGKADFFVSFKESVLGSSKSNSLYHEYVFGRRPRKKTSYRVKTITMDSFIEKNKISKIDFLKINCEGGEYLMFSAPTLDFLKKTRMIFIQIHGKSESFWPEEKQRIVDTLNNKGFKMIYGEQLADVGAGHASQLWIKR